MFLSLKLHLPHLRNKITLCFTESTFMMCQFLPPNSAIVWSALFFVKWKQHLLLRRIFWGHSNHRLLELFFFIWCCQFLQTTWNYAKRHLVNTSSRFVPQAQWYQLCLNLNATKNWFFFFFFLPKIISTIFNLAKNLQKLVTLVRMYYVNVLDIFLQKEWVKVHCF